MPEKDKRMKVVVLLAGKGVRMGAGTEDNHKSLVHLRGRPLLGYLIDRFFDNNIYEIVPIVGYQQDKVMKFLDKECPSEVKLFPIENRDYAVTNNMFSLYCARDLLVGSEFILCNGDVVLNGNIIRSFLHEVNHSAIVVDTHRRKQFLDSPKVQVEGNRICDLGRHISVKDSAGYAIGLYRFSAELSDAYFQEAERMVSSGALAAGFHDPLRALFGKYDVFVHDTCGLSWTDVDERNDVPRAEKLLESIETEEALSKRL